MTCRCGRASYNVNIAISEWVASEFNERRGPRIGGHDRAKKSPFSQWGSLGQHTAGTGRQVPSMEDADAGVGGLCVCAFRLPTLDS